jgi:SAM-dependent methyltransferase
MFEQTDFSQVAEKFGEHYDEVRGYVREHVTRHNLDAALRISYGKPKLHIADVGGGDGRDAEWAASFGHKVVLIDPNGAELDKARARADSYEVVQADAEGAFAIYRDSPFNLVISHGVLMYQDDPEKHIRQLAALIKTHGSLSLLTAGLLGKEERYAANRDIQNLESLRHSGRYINNLGLEARAYTPDELIMLLNSSGFNVLNWFGTRSVSGDNDSRLITDLNAAELDLIMEREVRHSRDENSRGVGQLLHFIARKK